MANITKRATKGSELSYVEVDANFSVLEQLAYFKAVSNSYSAVVNDKVIPDNSASSATVTLPSSPSNGDFVIVKQQADRPASTYSIVIGRNGNLINGVASNYTISTDGLVVMFTYITSNLNWEVDLLTSGDSIDAATLDGQLPAYYKDATTLDGQLPAYYKDATTLNGQSDTYYTNASNLSLGTVPEARLTSGTTVAKGIVQLIDSVTSTSTTLAATANSVKTAADNAANASNLTSGTVAVARLPSATTTAAGIAEKATQAEVDAGTDTDRYVTPETLANYSGVTEAGRFVSVSPPVSVYSSSTANDDYTIDLTAYIPNGGEAVFSFWFDYEYNGFAESWAGIVASDEIPGTWTKSLYAEMSAAYVDSGSNTHQTMGNLFKVSSTGMFRLHKTGSALTLYVRLIGYRAWA